jgi:hypothetical protein
MGIPKLSHYQIFLNLRDPCPPAGRFVSFVVKNDNAVVDYCNIYSPNMLQNEMTKKLRISRTIPPQECNHPGLPGDYRGEGWYQLSPQGLGITRGGCRRRC